MVTTSDQTEKKGRGRPPKSSGKAKKLTPEEREARKYKPTGGKRGRPAGRKIPFRGYQLRSDLTEAEKDAIADQIAERKDKIAQGIKVGKPNGYLPNKQD